MSKIWGGWGQKLDLPNIMISDHETVHGLTLTITKVPLRDPTRDPTLMLTITKLQTW